MIEDQLNNPAQRHTIRFKNKINTDIIQKKTIKLQKEK